MINYKRLRNERSLNNILMEMINEVSHHHLNKRVPEISANNFQLQEVGISIVSNKFYTEEEEEKQIFILVK